MRLEPQSGALRVGILCDAGPMLCWQRASVERLKEAGVRFCVIFRGRRTKSPNHGISNWLIEHAASWTSTLKEVPWPDFLRELPVVELDEKAAALWPAEAEAMPDAIIDLRRSPRPLAFAVAPRFGIWAFMVEGHSGQAAVEATLEAFASDRVPFSVALASTYDDVGAPVQYRQGMIGMEESFTETIDRIFSLAVLWFGLLPVLADAGDSLACPGTAPNSNSRAPRHIAFCLFLAGRRQALSMLRRLLLFERWNVGVCNIPIESLLDEAVELFPAWQPELSGFRYIADPFAAPDRPSEILCELIDAWTFNRGVIARVHLEKGIREIVIDQPFHLSYPFPFEAGGQEFCLPEASRSGRLVLYGRPNGDEDYSVSCRLLDVPAIDPTVVFWNGKWWLFCTTPELPHANLGIWHTEDLNGPWLPHPLNPVKTDIRSARPGGTPFMWRGRLYRPTQDCSMTYGGAVNLMEVTWLDEHGFEERLVRRVAPCPGRYSAGLHTVSTFGDRILIDGKRYEFAPLLFLRRLARRLTDRIRGFEAKSQAAIQ